MERIHADVVIMGGGGAACRAAIAAADAGASVLMVLKKKLGASGSTTIDASETAAYNVPMVFNHSDSMELFYNDVIRNGMGMAIPKLAQLLVEGAADRFRDLTNWGLRYATLENGSPLGLYGCFSSCKRGYAIKGHGKPIVDVLRVQIAKRSHIQVLENAMIIELDVRDGQYRGALAINERDELVYCESKAIVIAAGGASQVFWNNLNPSDVSGDSYALAYRAGVQLINMEFMQGGIGFQYPFKSLFQAHFWAGMPRVLNRNGEEFLPKNIPEQMDLHQAMIEHSYHFPFSCKDSSHYIDLAIQQEIENGRGTEHGGVYIDFRSFTEDYIGGLEFDANMKNLWPVAIEYFCTKGVDVMNDLVEISCMAQAINGGILIDEHAMSNIPGIFAAGEAAGGPHGADRLGGNMLMGSQVFGEIAGRCAAIFAEKQPTGAWEDHPSAAFERTTECAHKQVNFDEYNRVLCQAAQKNLLIGRNENGLRRLLKITDEIEEQQQSSPTERRKISRESILLRNKLCAVRIMSEAALARRESRGSHCRTDYPSKDDIHYGTPNLVMLNGKQLME